ncbi:NADPH:quinone reductase [Actinocatenispora thailandica]|uniref:NADPH:quinone reductase n=1 Tax=Actinocatenispora thailandica TaxID=227318 RepID=A0A7R7DJF1_9ACTN|nr:NADP-dependent oxidoreductase [Actinocatenispora thailandica]BCJ32522.1 NADPH:quinone reductase [Actinocatenispora thailandica]
MRIVTQQVFGGPEVLEVAEAEPPTPLPTEVLVQVRAAGVNPVDANIRAGRFPQYGQPPFTLGWDVSGVVTARAPGVTRFAVGDEVFGLPLFPRSTNAYAEYVAVPARQLVRKPPALDHVTAAGLPLAGLTAWQSLVDTAHLAAGERVLVHAGGGGVGHLAVQIAKAHGGYVIATASGAKRDFVASLGADEVIDYRGVNFESAVKDVDVVLDCVGGTTAERSIDALRPGGLLLTIVGHHDAALAERTERAGRRFAGVGVEPDSTGLDRLVELVEADRLRVHAEHVFPFDRAGDAHRLIETGSATGKIVLTP